MTTSSVTAAPARLVSLRLITEDVTRLVGFYERLTGVTTHWSTPDFAEVPTDGGTLAIGSVATVALFAPGSARAAANSSAIVEFLVGDVDAAYEQVRQVTDDIVAPPTTMPWGNRSLLLRDPDGNLVNLFTPVTPEAVAKFADRAR